MSDFDPSAVLVLQELRQKYPNTPFLALGQTIWWDEPMKAVLRKMLDELGLGGRMLLGVHDTDYFAKVNVRKPGQSHYELMPHNDGTTKDLWSAAGEISRLFGSESFPTRHDFTRHGVPYTKVLRSQPKDRLEFIDEQTEAWGWRGTVYTGSRDLIVHSMHLKEMLSTVIEMLMYGFDGTLETIEGSCCTEDTRRTTEQLLQWVRVFERDHPNTTLSELYQHCITRLYEWLLGGPPKDVDIDCTGHMLLLSPETASLPRFAFVDLFLNEKTRAIAADAYNQAVTGSEIYTLDRFGIGALPFDLVLPEHGRGTLRVTLRAIHVETPVPIRIPLKQPINSIQELAEILTREFGDHVTLVGKAVALISMLAREFIFVFNEEGSGYVTRTRQMNDLISAHGIDLPLHPILRLRYHTWDALEGTNTTFVLPDHLSAVFGRKRISGNEFAAEWRGVVKAQDNQLSELKTLRSPRALMSFLSERKHNGWQERLGEYDSAKLRLRGLHEQALILQRQVDELWKEYEQIKTCIATTEKAKGDHFRSITNWTPEEEQKRALFTAELIELCASRRSILAQIRDFKTQRLAMERGPEAEPLRQTISRIEAEAEIERMALIRNAILTRAGLPHTHHRPSAWWMPMVDPCGAWFRRIAATTEMYTQNVVSNC